jgi:hypothetical protein
MHPRTLRKGIGGTLVSQGVGGKRLTESPREGGIIETHLVLEVHLAYSLLWQDKLRRLSAQELIGTFFALSECQLAPLTHKADSMACPSNLLRSIFTFNFVSLLKVLSKHFPRCVLVRRFCSTHQLSMLNLLYRQRWAVINHRMLRWGRYWERFVMLRARVICASGSFILLLMFQH